MMGASKTFFVALLAAALLLGACAGDRTPRNMITYYTLEYAPPQASAKEPLPVVVRMERFSVSPLYNSTAIIYRDMSYKREAYVYYRWRANPGDLVSQFMARDFRASGLFQGVVPQGSRVRGSYLMEGGVEQFLERDLQDRWEALLTVNITLVAEDEPDISRRVVFQKTYSEVSPCKQKHPSALAEAMSLAMERLSGHVLADVYTRLAKRVRTEAVR
jgi:cholesterol transport system auxiliary component